MNFIHEAAEKSLSLSGDVEERIYTREVNRKFHVWPSNLLREDYFLSHSGEISSRSRWCCCCCVLVVVRGGCRWLTGARFTFLHNSLKVILPAPRPIRCITACSERKANESNRKQERKMRGRKIADAAAAVARCMRGNFFYVTAEPAAASKKKTWSKVDDKEMMMHSSKTAA